MCLWLSWPLLQSPTPFTRRIPPHYRTYKGAFVFSPTSVLSLSLIKSTKDTKHGVFNFRNYRRPPPAGSQIPRAMAYFIFPLQLHSHSNIALAGKQICKYGIANSICILNLLTIVAYCIFRRQPSNTDRSLVTVGCRRSDLELRGHRKHVVDLNDNRHPS